MGSDTELSTSSANVESETKVKRFACHYDDCQSVFNRQWKLDRHICCVHTKERPFKCDYPDCKKDYTSKAHLQRHIIVSHKRGDVTPVYIECPYPECFKQFQNRYSLKKHYKTHINENLYQCSECGLSFKKRRQLITHSYHHQESLPFTCPDCGKAFPSEKHVTKHQKKHKTYICEYIDCQEKFTAWSFLRAHLALKHKTQFKCDICNCTCLTKYTLTRHILKHLDKKDQVVHPCPYKDCFRFYKYKNNLQHHIRTTHEGKLYKCTEENCTQAFKSKNRLLDHLNRHKSRTLNAPRVVKPNKERKPRKDKGMKKKSMASRLSGVILHPNVDKSLVQNVVTPLVEESIKCTINNLVTNMKDLQEFTEDIESDCGVEDNPIEDNDLSKSVMYIVNRSKAKQAVA